MDRGSNRKLVIYGAVILAFMLVVFPMLIGFSLVEKIICGLPLVIYLFFVRKEVFLRAQKGEAKGQRYPEEFVKRVKAEYPDWPGLHEALDSGEDEFIGRFLNESSRSEISPEEIIDAFDQAQVQSLRGKAEQLLRRRKLYLSWIESSH